MDDRRRELERRFWASKSPQDAQRLIFELRRLNLNSDILKVRLALGELTQENVQLASYLGYEAAQELSPESSALDFKKFCEELWRWGHEPCLRACLMAADLAIQALGPKNVNSLSYRCLEAASNYLTDPSRENYRLAEDFNRYSHLGLPDWAYQTVTFAHCPPRAPYEPKRWVGCRHHLQALESAAAVVDQKTIRETIEEHLILWVLKDSDFKDIDPEAGEAVVVQTVLSGNMPRLKKLLKNKSLTPVPQQLALQTAARLGSLEMVQVLHEHGYDIRGAGTRNPVDSALSLNNQELVDYLLNSGAHYTADSLSIAIRTENDSLTQEILDSDIDLHAQDSTVQSVFDDALESGNTDLVEVLWQRGLRPQNLLQLIRHGNEELLRNCLSEGLFAKHTAPTPLTLCLNRQAWSKARICLDYLETVQARDMEAAIFSGQAEFVEAVWQHSQSQAEALDIDHHGLAAHAIYEGDTAAIQKILSPPVWTAEAQLPDDLLLLAIEEAHWSEDLRVLERLLEHGLADSYELDKQDPLTFLSRLVGQEERNDFCQRLEWLLTEAFCQDD